MRGLHCWYYRSPTAAGFVAHIHAGFSASSGVSNINFSTVRVRGARFAARYFCQTFVGNIGVHRPDADSTPASDRSLQSGAVFQMLLRTIASFDMP